jgi:hypothetical protein
VISVKLREILVNKDKAVFDYVVDPDLSAEMYKIYTFYYNTTNRFRIPLETQYDEYKIVDISMSINQLYENAKNIYQPSAHILELFNRLVSYIDYAELNEVKA